MTTMPTRKTAIAVPEELLAQVDAVAAERGESRSRFITTVLRAAVRARRDAEITRRLDALFADEKLAEEARSEAELFFRGAQGAWEREKW